MEKDDEVSGAGNSVNYEYRMHNPRLGRFMAVDPLTKKYPWNSPYAFSENIVIHGRELEGLEVVILSKNAGVDLLIGTAEAGGGIAFGPDGISGVGTYSYGFQVGSLVGANTNLSIAIYPDMPRTKYAGGASNTFSLGFDMPLGAGISIGASESGVYTGIVLKVSLGASVGVGVNVSYTWDNTTIKPIGNSEREVLNEAIPLLKTVSSEIKGALSSLDSENKSLRKEYKQYLDKNGKISKDNSNYKKYKNAYDKVVENNAKIKDLKKSLEVVEKTISEYEK